MQARVSYAGAAPGMVAGTLQVNCMVPTESPVGYAIPIVLSAGKTSSQAGVTLAIQGQSRESSIMHGDSQSRFLDVICIAVLCVILTLGLWPFHSPGTTSPGSEIATAFASETTPR